MANEIKYKNSLFIFRRDLRLQDNSALSAALRQSVNVFSVFIFDPSLLRLERSNACHFLYNCLDELAGEIASRSGQLIFLSGKPSNKIIDFIKQENIEAVFINRDYSPYALKRDQEIQSACKKLNVDFHCFADQLLLEPEETLKSDGKPYTVFTPYFRNATQKPVAFPQKLPQGNIMTTKNAAQLTTFLKKPINKLDIYPARPRATVKKILNNLHDFRHYELQRNVPALHGTTYLSAYLRFGVCSAREAFHCIHKNLDPQHPLIRQLYWRDFFTHIGFHFPHVAHGSFIPKYGQLEWDNNPKKFHAWCDGVTGFPIVDAGMRELNATGYMHNRVRMITASFLVKDLHIDWRKGEKYFADRLVDYDPLVNNGNWQWAASTGCDAQPWFRVFNPWLQQKKFDEDCSYILRWIPELNGLPTKEIHAPDRKITAAYPTPIINHAEAVALTKARYGRVAKP